MKALLLSLAACTAASPLPPRSPSEGVAPHPYPAHWNEPALLCINGYRMGYLPYHWRCM